MSQHFVFILIDSILLHRAATVVKFVLHGRINRELMLRKAGEGDRNHSAKVGKVTRIVYQRGGAVFFTALFVCEKWCFASHPKCHHEIIKKFRYVIFYSSVAYITTPRRRKCLGSEPEFAQFYDA